MSSQFNPPDDTSGDDTFRASSTERETRRGVKASPPRRLATASSPVLTRRRFLSRTGVGLAALAGADNLAQAQAGERKIGWAVVGLGGLSQYQILPGFAHCRYSRVTALVSGHPDKLKRLGDKYDVPARSQYSYETYDQLKNNPDVDAIYIVLPNSMHAEYTVRGAKAGKHILSEKPMATSVADCQAMIDACRLAGKKLMVAYRCQYEPTNRAAIQIARSKELGDVRSIVADHGFHIGDPTQWRLNRKLAGGGSLMDIGIYSLQAARYISGEEPVELSAFQSTPKNDVRFREVEADVNFVLRFPSGVLANCTSSYAYGGANRYRVLTTRGYYELEPATAYGGIQMFVQSARGPREERKFEQVDQFATEMDHFSRCILDNKEPRTPGEEGLRDIKIMMAIYESAREGKTIKFA